jgi:Putative zinc-finger
MRQTECEQARRRVSLQLDDELSAHEAVLLERHLSLCSSCARFAREAGSYTNLLRATPLEEAPATMLPRRAAPTRLSVRLGAAVGSTAAAALIAVSVVSSGKPSDSHSRVAALEFVRSGAAVNPPEDVPLGLRPPPALSSPMGRSEQGRLGSSRRGLVGN